MEDEKTMEFWAETQGIMISNLGNSKDSITIHKGHHTIRKRVTIDGKTIYKRFQVARLVLECFPQTLCFKTKAWAITKETEPSSGKMGTN